MIHCVGGSWQNVVYSFWWFFFYRIFSFFACVFSNLSVLFSFRSAVWRLTLTRKGYAVELEMDFSACGKPRLISELEDSILSDCSHARKLLLQLHGYTWKESPIWCIFIASCGTNPNLFFWASSGFSLVYREEKFQRCNRIFVCNIYLALFILLFPYRHLYLVITSRHTRQLASFLVVWIFWVTRFYFSLLWKEMYFLLGGKKGFFPTRYARNRECVKQRKSKIRI